MKIPFIVSVAFIAIGFFSGCAKPPTPAQIAAADYGPVPANYQKTVKDFMHQRLLDPYSAMYENWKGPSKGYRYIGSRQWYGYRVCVNINAKNRMGGYVGSSQHYFLINNERVLKYNDGSEGSFARGFVRGLCNF